MRASFCPGRGSLLAYVHAISFLALLILTAGPTSTLAGLGNQRRALSETSKYHKAHSLGDEYQFDPRDGWEVANVTDLQYKYPANHESHLAGHRRATRAKGKPAGITVGGALKGLVNTLKGLVGIGKPQKVTITWCVSTGQQPYREGF